MGNLKANSIKITNLNPTFTMSGMFDPSLDCDIKISRKDSKKIENLLLQMFSFKFKSNETTLGELIKMHKKRITIINKNTLKIQKIINKYKLTEKENIISIETYL
jgi:hypothetical protein